jgi:CD109 antigen
MSKKFVTLAVIITLALLVPFLPACKPAPIATAYTAVIPAILQSASKQTVSLAIFAGDTPTSGKVNLTLLKDGKEITQAEGNIQGSGEIQLAVPDVAEGDYTIEVKGGSFEDQAQVKVANNYVVFLETDKPIYKPGQTIKMRVMSLDAGLMPTSQSVTVEALDAKGIKIFRDETKTDEYGLATLELPVSSEPNLGTWKISAISAKAKTETDVKVEEYVLPKYEVKVDLPKDWFLVNEPIKGKVTATYSFGKPVKGELEIKATKYVGTWQDYASLKSTINGTGDFTVPAAQYVAGVPAAQGNGNVKLEFIVTEDSTGYQEKTDSLLTVAQSSVSLSIIPSGSTFKPGLPYSFMVVSETPDNQLIDTTIKASISYLDKNFKEIKKENKTSATQKGKALFEINPPNDSVALTINCNAQDAAATKSIEAAYSPSGNFIHLEQTSEGTPNVGDDIKFYVFSTKEAVNFYYEVISRGAVVFSSYTKGNEITFKTTPAMAPSAKLLVYQVLPNAELAADYLPFKVTAQYPQNVKLDLSTLNGRPGDSIDINIQAEGQAEVGLAAVDKSVFILAENRMNLQQVFDELEKLYMNPQAELHEVSIYEGIQNRGAKEVFQDAGVIVLSNKKIPEGKKYESPARNQGILPGIGFNGAEKGIAPPMMAAGPMPAPAPTLAQDTSGAGLAAVQRVRQLFPETWIWDVKKTDSSGKVSFNDTIPDTITTWMLRAVAISKTKGLGIAENQLTVFQPFFLSVDLPYSAIRGEEFPVKVAIYNYLDQPQSVLVQIQPSDWFDLLDDSGKTITIQANDIGGAEFNIRPTRLGNANEVKITARSSQAADAVIKKLIIEAEGAARETVDNIALSNGKVSEISTAVPEPIVEGSARAIFAVTSSYLTQTIDGLESLIQMPFGCGEQNMIIFAPDVFISKYLQESGQLKPEIMAKAEKLMLTGYQRELTYRRTDGSFSAFGQTDQEGSLWLTAFVLKCFSEAKGLIYIDDQVLDQAKSWILSHQNSDGSFDAVGFIHHQELLGGIKGKDALTAFVAVALMEAGDQGGSGKAVTYLAGQLDQTDDPYTVALITYALELAGNDKADEAYNKLMKLAKEDENGLHWASDEILPLDQGAPQPGLRMAPMPIRPIAPTTGIEATAYATLALIKHGDSMNASRAAKWLVSKRNANGGFGSTQDTVMALQALIEYSTGARADVDLTINIESTGRNQQLKVNAQNFDILQTVDLPVNDTVKISVAGKGEAIAQIVERFNVPEVIQEKNDILKVDVKYNADQVAVNDEVRVDVNVSFNPPSPMEAGMVVVDVAVPTGFAAVKESIDKVVANQANLKRYDISGRKVIFYVENMLPGDKVSFSFMVKALYPVKAKGVASQAYSYYKPEISAESLSQNITVTN